MSWICFHILLGRPWQYDVNAIHRGRDNSYAYQWNDRKIVILPSSPRNLAPAPTLLTLSSNDFYRASKESPYLFALVYKE